MKSLGSCLMLCLAFVALWCGAARAEDGDSVKPAPRAVVLIGGASIVLVAANGRLVAYVDRVADNAPIEDSRLTLLGASDGQLALQRVSSGLFVAPLARGGRARDIFTVQLASAEENGEARAVIEYGDAAAPDVTAARSREPLGPVVLAVAAVLGACAFSLSRWQRDRRRQVIA